MKNNLDIKQILTRVTAFGKKVLEYLPFIFIVALLLMYGFLVFRINSLNSAEPSDDAVTEKLKTVQRPKVDQATVDKLQQLQDNSSDVKTLFNQARENPFQE